ncbi:hypothetical protein VE04_01449 [Pseudogymnoascus sp. 24MN13]|nr:hypothetical protein VE04_01449 [Pseudogymnoascus sp. 24MN13]
MSGRNESTRSEWGTTGLEPFLPIVPAPSIAFEWAALIPLVIYLASYKSSHTLVGKTSLTGRLCIGLFPKLGVLGNVASLLKEGSDYLDRACSISELRKDVWDANFGSKFPCANGAASDLITCYVTRGNMPISVESTIPSSGPTFEPTNPTAQQQPQFRRYQTLHLIQLSRGASPLTLVDKVRNFQLSLAFQLLLIFCLLGCAIITALFGLIGTTAAIVTSVCIQLCCQVTQIQRPSRFLGGNEPGQACMLTALHNNATTWCLFAGDRGIVDGILNKSMIYSVNCRFGERSTRVLSYIFAILGFLQLLLMTYVASQKGWDGIGLLALVTVCWAWEHVVQSDNSVVKEWVTTSDIDVKVTTFEFSGRTAMLGSIQVWKKTFVETWMDDILEPTPRREVWLSYLAGTNDSRATVDIEKTLNDRDKRWVKGNVSRTREALKIWKQKIAVNTVP